MNEPSDQIDCPSCEGRGYHEIYYDVYDCDDEPCARCLGTGLIDDEEYSIYAEE